MAAILLLLPPSLASAAATAIGQTTSAHVRALSPPPPPTLVVHIVCSPINDYCSLTGSMVAVMAFISSRTFPLLTFLLLLLFTAKTSPEKE